MIEIMAPVGSYASLAAAIEAGAGSVYFGIQGLNMRSASAVNFTVDDLPRIAAICRRGQMDEDYISPQEILYPATAQQPPRAPRPLRSYLTVNTIIYNGDLATMRRIIDAAAEAGISAIIAADVAAMAYARGLDRDPSGHAPRIEVHLSTQLNISNVEALRFYAQFADVVVLARELTLDQVRAIRDAIVAESITGPSGRLVRIEMFAHGALCMAVSGKCYMSLHTYGKSANRGACAQVCRHGYAAYLKAGGTAAAASGGIKGGGKAAAETPGDLKAGGETSVEAPGGIKASGAAAVEAPGGGHPHYELRDLDHDIQLEVDNQYIMSPKDLRTIHFLGKMMDAGVEVYKIEGRARGPEYVRTVVECYREAAEAVERLGLTRAAIESAPPDERRRREDAYSRLLAGWDERLLSVFNRGFWDGYYLGQRLGEWSHTYGSQATRHKVYAAKVVGWYSRIGVGDMLCEAEPLHRGDHLVIIGPTTGVIELDLDEVQVDYRQVETVRQGDRFTIPIARKIRPSDKVYVMRG